jgi:hypothetical protein
MAGETGQRGHVNQPLARPSQLDPEITNFCRREDENASPIKGRHFEVGCSVDQGSFRIADFS